VTDLGDSISREKNCDQYFCVDLYY